MVVVMDGVTCKGSAGTAEGGRALSILWSLDCLVSSVLFLWLVMVMAVMAVIEVMEMC